VGYRLITEAWRIGGGRPDLDAATDAEVEAALGAAVKRQRLDIDLIRRRGAAGELRRTEHSIPAAFRRTEGGR
jgi:hypothetical protein